MLLCPWVIVLNLSHYAKLLYLALLEELWGLIVTQMSWLPAFLMKLYLPKPKKWSLTRCSVHWMPHWFLENLSQPFGTEDSETPNHQKASPHAKCWARLRSHHKVCHKENLKFSRVGGIGMGVLWLQLWEAWAPMCGCREGGKEEGKPLS